MCLPRGLKIDRYELAKKKCRPLSVDLRVTALHRASLCCTLDWAAVART